MAKAKRQVNPDELYTANQVAELLKVAPSTVTSWKKKGRLVPHGGTRRFLGADLIEFAPILGERTKSGGKK